MKTRYLILAALIVIYAFLGQAPWWAAVLALFVLAVSWQIHALEVRVNRLLDERGIRVFDDEVAR